MLVLSTLGLRMRQARSFLCLASILVLLPPLTGCVNLQAISDYSASAGAVLGNKAPLVRWHESETRLLAQRLEGDQCSIGRSGRPAQADYDAAFTQAAVVHDTLSQYFGALGELASNHSPKPAQTLDSSLDNVKHLGVNISPAEEAALHSVGALLGRALEGYRQEKIRDLMEQTHADVDRLIVLLQKLGALYRDEVNGERIQAVQFLRCSMAPGGELSDKFWGRREILRVQRSYQSELSSLDTYAASLVKIRQDHEVIRQALAMDDPRRLKDTLHALAETRKELDAASSALHALRPATPAITPLTPQTPQTPPTP
ncbi:hypothetical protein LepocDRAFT_00001520 [Leptothrix ochracea L12]|uniref:Uncharacterized protein n=1 Tax=Leptothrix ochracea L12 TaxID=735332 RepID=I4Z5D2_9BURK|nr:hypothetical protein [Leptothrix ochracea]EIM31424.1 hypothetical protein LepocDRAFT_00001520 [Leptothrix ochracea L12]